MSIWKARCVEGAAEAYDRFGLVMRYTPDLYRGLEPEIAEQMAQLSVRYADQGVVGLGLGGVEGAVPVACYDRAFAIARQGGLGIVPHAGESAGPESVREVLALDPRRIRHGVRAAEDDDRRPRGCLMRYHHQGPPRQTLGGWS